MAFVKLLSNWMGEDSEASGLEKHTRSLKIIQKKKAGNDGAEHWSWWKKMENEGLEWGADGTMSDLRANGVKRDHLIFLSVLASPNWLVPFCWQRRVRATGDYAFAKTPGGARSRSARTPPVNDASHPPTLFNHIISTRFATALQRWKGQLLCCRSAQFSFFALA